MADSLNDAVFTRREHAVGVAVTCVVQAVNTSPRVSWEPVRDRLVSLAEKVVTGRPVHVLGLAFGEDTTATLMLADEEKIRAADVRGWMAEACNVPVEQVVHRHDRQPHYRRRDKRRPRSRPRLPDVDDCWFAWRQA
jgi:hypothetical protein